MNNRIITIAALILALPALMQPSAPTAKRKLSVTDWIQKFENNIHWNEHDDPQIVMTSAVAEHILSKYHAPYNDDEKIMLLR